MSFEGDYKGMAWYSRYMGICRVQGFKCRNHRALGPKFHKLSGFWHVETDASEDGPFR